MENNKEIKTIDNHKENKDFNEKKSNKFWEFIKRNKMSTFLFILLIVVGIWTLIKVQSVKTKADKEIKMITETTNQKIDSISTYSLKQTATVFSWAIRSELTRQNFDQIDQFFMNFVRQPNVAKLCLINPSTNKVTISTDKKDEGSVITDKDIISNEIIIKNSQGLTRVISPIMGLNEKLGVLIIDYNN